MINFGLILRLNFRQNLPENSLVEKILWLFEPLSFVKGWAFFDDVLPVFVSREKFFVAYDYEVAFGSCDADVEPAVVVEEAEAHCTHAAEDDHIAFGALESVYSGHLDVFEGV